MAQHTQVVETAKLLTGLHLPDLTRFEANLIQPSGVNLPTPDEVVSGAPSAPSRVALEYAAAWRSELLSKGGARHFYRHGEIGKCASFSPTRLHRPTIEKLFPDSDPSIVWQTLQDDDHEFLAYYELLIEVRLSHWVRTDRIRVAAQLEAEYRLEVAKRLHQP